MTVAKVVVAEAITATITMAMVVAVVIINKNIDMIAMIEGMVINKGAAAAGEEDHAAVVEVEADMIKEIITIIWVAEVEEEGAEVRLPHHHHVTIEDVNINSKTKGTIITEINPIHSNNRISKTIIEEDTIVKTLALVQTIMFHPKNNHLHLHKHKETATATAGIIHHHPNHPNNNTNNNNNPM